MCRHLSTPATSQQQATPTTAVSHCSRGGYGVGRVQGTTEEGKEEGEQGKRVHGGAQMTLFGPQVHFYLLFFVLSAHNMFSFTSM
jgi:hypothetical protein